MQLGMIGLGRMGANMVIRLIKAGHELHVYDRHAGPVRDLAKKGAEGSTDLEAFVGGLTAPRAVWLMVPAAAVDPVLASLTPLLDPGDTVIDGGNSFYQDDIRRAETLRTKGLQYVDIGVSGGVWGLERGYCQMIGGDERWLRAWIRSSAPSHLVLRPRPVRPASAENRRRPSTATCIAAQTVLGIS